jgi:hypothetical protein
MARLLNPVNNSLMQMSPVPSKLNQVTHTSRSFGLFYGEDPLNFKFNLVLLDLSLIILISKMIRILLKPQTAKGRLRNQPSTFNSSTDLPSTFNLHPHIYLINTD